MPCRNVKRDFPIVFLNINAGKGLTLFDNIIEFFVLPQTSGSIDNITSPRFENKGGHPVIFSSKLRKEILTLDEGDGGLRKVFNAYRDVVNEVRFSDPEIHLDLNTLEEYETAVSLYCS